MGVNNSTPQQILDAFRVPDWPNWYTIGYGEDRVTVYTQQVRALNLAWALKEDGRVADGTRVFVIGGGFAGLTAAAGLAHLGATVTVLEKARHLLPLQRNCHKRYLHPHVFDWPEDTADNPRAGLPLLDWRAGMARDVALQVEDAFDHLKHESDGGIGYHCQVDNIQLESPGPGRIEFRIGRQGRERHAYDMLVFALGFGLEDEVWAGRRGSYWADDSLEQHGVVRSGRYLVSGVGDGALIDMFRLLMPEVTQPDLVRTLRETVGRYEEFTAWVQAIDKSILGLSSQESGIILSEQYASFDPIKFDAAALKDAIGKYLNEGVNVTLVVRAASAFAAKSRPLHRFYLSRLLFDFSPHVDLCCNTSLIPELLQPAGSQVEWRREVGDPERFEHAIVRHGPSCEQVYATFPQLRTALLQRQPSELGQERQYPHDYFGQPGAGYRGVGGPNLDNYLDELWGSGYLTESVEERIPLGRFRDIALELRASEGTRSIVEDETEETSEEESETRANVEENPGPRASADQRQGDRRNRPERNRQHSQLALELNAIAQRRLGLPGSGVPLIPSAPNLDFGTPTFIHGEAGCGKTTLVKHLVHEALRSPQKENSRILPLLIGTEPAVLDRNDDIARALTQAALFSAELSNFSRAAAQIEEALKIDMPASHSRRLRIFLDGVETWRSQTLETVVLWIVERKHELVVSGRRFPVEPSRIGFRLSQVYELLGITPRDRTKFLELHAGSQVVDSLSFPFAAGVPFLLLEALRAAKTQGTVPTSALAVYELRVKQLCRGLLEEAAMLARRMLMRERPALTFRRSEMAPNLAAKARELPLFAGSEFLEFAHLSYGEYLAAVSIEAGELKALRSELRERADTWHHSLDVLAMAHAMRPGALEACFHEVDEKEAPHLRQVALVFRAIAFGGDHVEVFCEAHASELVEVASRAVNTRSARFGDEERDLAHYALSAAEKLRGRAPAKTAPDLFGEPGAFRWALERALGIRGDGRPPHSYWWRTVHSEALALIDSSSSIDEIVSMTTGASDLWEQHVALRVLGGSLVPLLASSDEWRRRGMRTQDDDLRATPHAFNLLVDFDGRNRTQAWAIVAQSVLPMARMALGRSVLRNDPYSGVHAAIAGGSTATGVEPDMAPKFRALLKKRTTIQWDEQQLFSELLKRFHADERFTVSIQQFVERGWSWFLSDDDWKVLLTSGCHDAIREFVWQDLESEDPHSEFVRAAAIVPELYPQLRTLLQRLVEARKRPGLLAQCIASLPKGDAETRGLRIKCAEFKGDAAEKDDPNADARVRAHAVASLAVETDAEDLLRPILTKLDEPGPVEAALEEKAFRATPLALQLALRVVKDKLTDEDWNNCLFDAIATVAEHPGQESFLREQLNRLNKWGGPTLMTLDYRRARLLENINPGTEELIQYAADRHDQVRIVALKLLEPHWDTLSEQHREELIDQALVETNQRCQLTLWQRFINVPKVRSHVERKSRTDLWAVRRSAFRQLSETDRCDELLRFMIAIVEKDGDRALLAELVHPLARDSKALERLRLLLSERRDVVQVLLRALRYDKELRLRARAKLFDEKWAAKFFMSSALEEYFSEDEVAKKALFERVTKNGTARPLSDHEAVAILGRFPPARQWVISQAVQSADMNSARAGRTLYADEPEVRKVIEEALNCPASSQEFKVTADAVQDVHWAWSTLAKHQCHSDRHTRSIALQAALRLTLIPDVLRKMPAPNDDLQRREPDLKLRTLIVEHIDSIPIGESERTAWLRSIATGDYEWSVRLAATEKLARPAEWCPALRDQPFELAVGKLEEPGREIRENREPELFRWTVEWVTRKLVSSLADHLDMAYARLCIDEFDRLLGEVLPSAAGVTFLRLAKDTNELPRDRRIWPATNLILAWERACHLVASEPTTIMLACADLRSDELEKVMPQLEAGEVHVGPVFFGFRLREEPKGQREIKSSDRPFDQHE